MYNILLVMCEFVYFASVCVTCWVLSNVKQQVVHSFLASVEYLYCKTLNFGG